MRLGACMGAAVDLIEPMGFPWDDRRVRRAQLRKFFPHERDIHRSPLDHRRLLDAGYAVVMS